MKKEKVILANDDYCISEIRKDTGELILSPNIENALLISHFEAFKLVYKLKDFRIITVQEWEACKAQKNLMKIAEAFNCFGA